WFRDQKLPPTIRVESRDAPVKEERFDGARRIIIPLSFNYDYGDFPSEMNLFFHAGYSELEPFVRLTWRTPDGREIRMGGHTVSHDERISISQDWNLERRLGTLPHVGLFAAPGSAPAAVQPGRDRLEIEARW